MAADMADQAFAHPITHRRHISDAPPAYPGPSTSQIVAPSPHKNKDQTEDADVTSIHSSVPPDSPRTTSLLGPDSPARIREEKHNSDQHEQLPPPAFASITAQSGPDINHPFDFPPLTEPPPYVADESATRPIAIPQLLPYPDVGLLAAYPPSLLAYGIPEPTWLSFIATLSSFLDATIPQQALSHASKIARSTAKIPRDLTKGIQRDAVDGLKQIKKNALKGNLFGIVGTVVGLPLGLVGRTVGSVFSLQGAIVQAPETPRQRADMYVETANKRWLHPRGLHGRIAATAELAGLAGMPLGLFAKANTDATTAQQQMDSFTQYLAPIKIAQGSSLVYADPLSANPASESKGKRRITSDSLMLGEATLWLVVHQDETRKIRKH